MQSSDLVNDAERRLWDSFARGRAVDLGSGNPTTEGFDPDTWSEDRQVRGEVIARLLLGARERDAGYVARVVLAGARIVGELDISNGQTDCELILDRCWLDRAPNFSGASSGPAIFQRSRLPGLVASDWQTVGSVSFYQSHCHGFLRINGARIGGRVTFNGATLSNPNGIALAADGLTAEQDLFCRGGFSATGEVRLVGARIGGQVDFSGATLNNAEGIALAADGLGVDQGMFCTDGFTATGQVRLLNAHIHAELSFSGATLASPEGVALNADGLTVDQDMSCSDGFNVTGEIRLVGAHIGSSLDFSGAALTNPEGHVLSADRITVNEGIFCTDGFTTNGELRFPGAKVDGALYLSGATLTNPGGVALNGDQLTLGQGMFCTSGFTAKGRVGLIHSRIAGRLSFHDATLVNPGQLALDLERMECPYVELPRRVEGWIDLTAARLGVLDTTDEREQPPMRLTGLTYTDLDPDPDPPAKQRIGWLNRDPAGFHPQPYEQLAAYYRSIGHDRDARKVLLAKQRVRRRITPNMLRVRGFLRPVVATAWRTPGWLIDALSGYGYVPWRAFCWLLAAITTGAALLHDVAPTTPTGDSRLNALLLALDATVPTGPFGIRENVTLTGTNFGVAFGLQVLGYALVLAVLPAVSRALSRSER